MGSFNKAVVLGVALAISSCDAISTRTGGSHLDTYTFDKFMKDYGRDYAPGSVEFQERYELFEASLVQVKAINARNRHEGRLWKAGIHKFMDWSVSERKSLNGYKRPDSRADSAVVSLISQLRGSQRLNASAFEEIHATGGLDINSGPAIRDQGNCGSCWAISAAEAIEAQMQKAGLYTGEEVSAQALVDCVPNPHHCGGSGGCEGATGELAYAWVRDHGIPLDQDLPYTASTGTCAQPNGLWQTHASRIRVSGWDQLPSNRAQPLMQALVEKGPVVVAVDGNNWFNYDSGIFDDCSKDAILGHAVLAKAYGKDEAGNKYWLIQNSWGSEWGEAGHIRLLRHDDEDSWCGTDSKPSEGVGCDGGPSQVTVCGTCGLLYDPIVPTGVSLEHGTK